MKKRLPTAWIALIVVNGLLWMVFPAGPRAIAEPTLTPEPTNNPAEQRAAMIKELAEIKAALKLQNEILKGALGDD